MRTVETSLACASDYALESQTERDRAVPSISSIIPAAPAPYSKSTQRIYGTMLCNTGLRTTRFYTLHMGPEKEKSASPPHRPNRACPRPKDLQPPSHTHAERPPDPSYLTCRSKCFARPSCSAWQVPMGRCLLEQPPSCHPFTLSASASAARPELVAEGAERHVQAEHSEDACG